MKTDIELKKIYKKYVDQKVYRVIPISQKSTVLRKGFDPKKDPHKKYISKINRMFRIIERLERKGIIFKEKWRDGMAPGSKVVQLSRRSLNTNYIDFVADKKQVKRFKRKWKGSCLVNYVYKLTNFLLDNLKELKNSERELVKDLNKWAKSRTKDKFVVIYIKGSNKIFESSKFYRFHKGVRKMYWRSPFGSFDYFKKAINQRKLSEYLPYLKHKKLFYLRVNKKISPKEIKFLENLK
jgi:hypothetical protein